MGLPFELFKKPGKKCWEMKMARPKGAITSSDAIPMVPISPVFLGFNGFLTFRSVLATSRLFPHSVGENMGEVGFGLNAHQGGAQTADRRSRQDD